MGNLCQLFSAGAGLSLIRVADGHLYLSAFNPYGVHRQGWLELGVVQVVAVAEVVGIAMERAGDGQALHLAVFERPPGVGALVGDGVGLAIDVEDDQGLSLDGGAKAPARGQLVGVGDVGPVGHRKLLS